MSFEHPDEQAWFDRAPDAGPRCPIDGSPLVLQTLPQPGKSHACLDCGMWWA